MHGIASILARAALVLAAGTAPSSPSWTQHPDAGARLGSRVVPVLGIVRAADSLPALEVMHEASDSGVRVRVQLLTIDEGAGGIRRVVYAGERVFREGDAMCHLGYPVRSGRTTLADLLARLGRGVWDGPAADGIELVGDRVVLGEMDGLGFALCCPADSSMPPEPRIFLLAGASPDARCWVEEDRDGRRVGRCEDDGGGGGTAVCAVPGSHGPTGCLETRGSFGCRLIGENGFEPEPRGPEPEVVEEDLSESE